MSTVPIPKILANFETSLAATMSASATTLTLNRSTDADGSTLSGLYSLTFDEGTTSEEHMTVTLTGASGVVSRRGQSRVDGFTEVSGNKYRHERGASVKITSFALLNIQRLLNGTDTFDAVDWAGINSITGLATPTSGETTKAANVAYVNAVSIAGGSNASTTQQGFVEASTTSENTSGASVGGTGALLFSTPAQIAAQIQSGSWLSGTTAGTASAITATLTPTLTTYAHNMILALHITTANNAGCTLNVDGLGAKAVYKYAGGTAIAVEANDMKASYHHIFLYDSDASVFLLVNPVNGDLTATNRTLVETNLPTLTNSVTSDASALHYHKVSSPVTVTSNGNGGDYGAYTLDLATRAVAGWSDTNGVLGFMLGTTTTFEEYYNFKDASVFGFQPMVKLISNSAFTVASSSTANGYVYITTDRWACTSSTIYKNGSSATISGTARYGVLGHDPTNSYLLVLYSSTAIAKFSGISGTTITNVNADVTLDTAVAQNRSFIYDSTNSRYICIDNTNKVIRRFNSTGTTIDTLSISGILDNLDSANKILGLCVYQGRVMVAVMSLLVPGANTAGSDMIQMSTTFYPTSMTI